MPLAGSLKGVKGDTGSAGRGFNPTGAWQLTHLYAIDDVFTHGGNTYHVTTGYTSSGTFGSADTTNTEVWATAGTNGTNGTNGAAGSVWSDGAGVPSDANGANGDYYLNDTNGDYYKKVAGTWF